MKEQNLKLQIRILLEQNIAFGPGKADLLEAIERTGSISQAAKSMNMSYRRAWQLVDTMNQHQCIWGVGRGSSVASYVLYLLGVHRINSMYYELDISEFLR